MRLLAARTLAQAARDAAATANHGTSALYIWQRRRITDWLDEGAHEPFCRMLDIDPDKIEQELRRLAAGETDIPTELVEEEEEQER